jgi:two-component system response regulator BaeR/two-component system response regulator AdeR
MAGELVLIVEDETRIADVLEVYLRSEGFRTERAADGKQGLELWRTARPDLMLLDLMIPQVSGLEVLKSIRRESEIPILLVTAKVEESDRVIGLELGADDYILKPFSAREVVARVKTVLRRSRNPLRPREQYQIGNLEIDMEAFRACCQGQELPLTPTHLRLLGRMAAHPGRAFSRAELLAAIGEADIDERTVDAHIKNLRIRMRGCGRLLETVRGIGYRLCD